MFGIVDWSDLWNMIPGPIQSLLGMAFAVVLISAISASIDSFDAITNQDFHGAFTIHASDPQIACGASPTCEIQPAQLITGPVGSVFLLDKMENWKSSANICAYWFSIGLYGRSYIDQDTCYIEPEISPICSNNTCKIGLIRMKVINKNSPPVAGNITKAALPYMACVIATNYCKAMATSSIVSTYPTIANQTITCQDDIENQINKRAACLQQNGLYLFDWRVWALVCVMVWFIQLAFMIKNN